MKKFCYTWMMLVHLAMAGTLFSQTNETARPTTTGTNANTNAISQILALVTTNPPPAKPRMRSETVIQADGAADFNQTGRGLRVVYQDHVRVESPGLKLTCEWLAAELDQVSGRVTNIIAETNVVIDATDDKGQKMHAIGDKAVYMYDVVNGATNETVTLTGNAKAEYKDITLTGNPIIWDRGNNRLTVPSNPKMVFNGSVSGVPANTNSTVVETNVLPVETNAPSAVTNPAAPLK